MQHTSVEKLFKEQVRQYSHKDQYKHSPLTPLILKWLQNNKTKSRKTNLPFSPRRGIEICEFGGGAGQLLGEIRKSYPHYRYTNVEIVKDYKRFLASKDIHFVLGSILQSDFKSQAFDMLIMRDVLHHLVGRNYKETSHNQRLALQELKRLVKPGGVIFIEELTNESELATRIIYYLSWLNSRIGLRVSSLFISSHVIVAFLTSNKLLNMCHNIFGKKNVRKHSIQVETKWYLKVVHLFSGLKKVIVTVKS